jgi:hypothetical protein
LGEAFVDERATLKQIAFSRCGIKSSFFRTCFALVLAGIQRLVIQIKAVEKDDFMAGVVLGLR